MLCAFFYELFAIMCFLFLPTKEERDYTTSFSFDVIACECAGVCGIGYASAVKKTELKKAKEVTVQASEKEI